MKALILVVVVVATGCKIYPGNGRLVIVECDSAISASWVQTGIQTAHGWVSTPETIEPATPIIAQGLHYWDSLGVRLRGIDDLLPTDEIESSTPVLHIVSEDGCHASAACQAWYDESDGRIHVPLPWRAGGTTGIIKNLIAHEAGHAIGLHHVDGIYNIMSVDSVASEPGVGDIKEFHSVWGG